MTTTINVRTDSKQKKKAAKIFKEMGLDMSSGIKLFLQQVIITESIPFPIRTANGFTQEGEVAMLNNVSKLEKEIEAGTAKTFDSAEEMMKEIMDESDV